MNKRVLLALSFAVTSVWGYTQNLAVKTNVLYGAYTYTPNLSSEFGLGRRTTIDISGGYNFWNLNGSMEDNKKLVHWLGQIEYRHWFCEKFNGHFFGVHTLGTQYNISGYKLPLIFGKDSRNYRYEGYGYGGGISYGYHWILSKRWSLEATIGLGYVRVHYDKYECKKCGEKLAAEKRNYIGPTKAGISLIYIIK